MTDISILDNSYIHPYQAARPLDIPVREVCLLQAQGKLTDVVTTPGNPKCSTC